jgi:hypothetical protein
MDLDQPATITTTERPMLGPPHPSDTDGLVPTLAALVRSYDHVRREAWAAQVAKHRERMQRWARQLARS